MSKRSYICLKCRTSKRADAAYGGKTKYHCPICKESLVELPWNWRIPKKQDDGGWYELETMLAELRTELIYWRRTIAQQELSRIEGQIDRLTHQKPSSIRNSKLAKLRWDKRRVEELYSEELTDPEVNSEVEQAQAYLLEKS